MRCACCGRERAADCYSGRQRKRPAASRKCSECASAGNIAGNTNAAPLGTVATGVGSGADADHTANTPQRAVASGAHTAPAEATAATATAAQAPVALSSNSKVCAWVECGKQLSADPALQKKCGQCKKEFYCGRACQKKHWGEGGHKDECEEPPCCAICLEGGDEPLPVQRGCGCRGDAGLAHTVCMAKMNVHKGGGYHKGWYACPTCGQWYTGVMRLALAHALVRRTRHRHRDDDDRLCADTNLGAALYAAGEWAEAAGVQTRVLAARERVRGK